MQTQFQVVRINITNIATLIGYKPTQLRNLINVEKIGTDIIRTSSGNPINV